jgi:fructosamine-3-kinase
VEVVDHDLIARFAGAPVAATTPLSGGDVAQSYRVELVDGTVVFAKTHANPPPHFFSTEAAGLTWLRDGLASAPERPSGLDVPEVIGCSDDPPLLVLAWIDQSRSGRPDEPSVGRALAALHRAGAPAFGRQDGRTTGSRRMPNDPSDTWAEFYGERRLRMLARLADDSRALPTEMVTGIESVADRLDQLGGPTEPPARLHGDLWAGNRIVDSDGQSWLIDPACYGGHREFDLAMMQLFGGFGPEVFAAYHEVFPLADGHADRVALHQLAPLIVHAIKFGGGYVSATAAALDRYR